MKKIIYSLVIMIAAGSLFTSCVTNTEPQGIKDIREAKANYLDALANLRAADAAVRNADAEYRKAETELKQAEAAIAEAAAKAAEIAVTLEDAAVQAKIAEIKAQAEIDAVKAQKKLAKAQAALDSTLRNLAATSLELTGEEQTVISNYTEAYQTYIEKEGDVRKKQEALWVATNQWDDEGKKPVKRSLEETKASYEKEIAQAEAQIAKHQAKLEEYSAVAESERAKYDVWKAEYDAYADSVKDMQYETEKIRKERAYYQVETNEAFEAFVAYVKKADDKVTTAVNKAAAQEFGMNFTGDKAFALPTQKVNNGVVDKFASYIGSIDNIERNKITVAGDKKKMSVVFAKQDSAKAAIFGTDDATKYSLAGIIDALKRDSVIVETFIKDTTGLAKFVAGEESKYKKKLDTLKNMKLMGYPKVKESIAAYNQAKTDSATAKVALDKALDSLQSKWNTLVGVWGQTERGTKELSVLLAKDSYVAFQNAIKDFAKARKAYFGEAAVDGCGLDSIKVWKSQKISGEDVFEAKAIADLTAEDFAPAKVGTSEHYVTILDIDAKQGNELMARMHAYNKVLGTLLAKYSSSSWTKQEKDFSAAGNTDFGEVHFAAPVFDNKGKIATWGQYKYVKIDSKKSNYVALSDGTPFTPANLVGKEKAQNDAKIAFYKNVYCEFWGIDYNVNLFNDSDVTKGLKDSLQVRYKEDTFAGLINFNYGGKPWDGGKIEYDAINLLDNAELNIILDEFAVKPYYGKRQLYQDDKTEHKWTLYLKSLAAKAVLADAQNYSDNQKTLAALDEVVNKVKEAYNAAVTKKENKAAIALADSLVNEFLGKDIVAYVYAITGKDSKKVNPYSIWNGDLKTFRVITHFADVYNPKQEEFQWCIDEGEYFLGGIQLEAAETLLPDYAEKIQAWWDAEEDMEKATANLEEFEEILSEYVKEIADLDGYKKISDRDDVDDVAAKVDKAWKKFLGKIENAIVKFENDKRSAEQALAKLEAGYDPQQAAIEKAQGELDNALAALEAAEARLAAAEAAYKQVLANHGLAE